jgi:hypothetical protein
MVTTGQSHVLSTQTSVAQTRSCMVLAPVVNRKPCGPLTPSWAAALLPLHATAFRNRHALQLAGR